MTDEKYFQSMIMALNKYWADQDCLIWHPYYSQLGAGTMNPATFLRVLGPEPWNVGYLEPSVRPDDGRYGKNPNRLQMFYQYQVILKPDPGDPQEMYLRSLEVLGIDPKKHDIRFVEDNWESPALGAWGLGWEVWMDGLEITQFTYFQQAGQQELNPVSVEITYGLDRIAAPLQGVNNFKDIQWNRKHSFGDMNLQGEQEHSKYYFEIADVERTRKIYELTKEEVQNGIDENLIFPAYDNLLKLSHIFNILDTRGAIGVTERAQFFKDMRTLATKIGRMYVEDRERQEFPWMDTAPVGEAVGKTKKVESATLSEPADFLFEVGTEELPPKDLESYLGQLDRKISALLEKLRLDHGDVQILGTPRRLVAFIKDLAPSQPDRQEIYKGPPASRAYDDAGKITKAAEGFARGKGISVEDLKVKEIDGGEYVTAEVFEKGQSTVKLLVDELPKLLASLKVDKSMRWNESNVSFSRPIRWLNVIYGSTLIPIEFAGLYSAKETRGLRFSSKPETKIDSVADYFKYLKAEGIILEQDARREMILDAILEKAASVGGEIKMDERLLLEVTHLVESPSVLLGQFDPEHLSLPHVALEMVMKKHQRYFPIWKDGKLMPYFIFVRNGGLESAALVIKGNENVLRARFADAAFFYSEDLNNKLEDYLPKLESLAFQAELGSMGDKTRRISSLVSKVSEMLGLNDIETKAAQRAAELCKADLTTKLVVEMTSLQGIMGQIYAEISGESKGASLAIAEHYLSSSAEDAAGISGAGLAVGIADRLDSLAGLFAISVTPTGAKDPFALRRAGISLVQNLIGKGTSFDIKEGLNEAASLLPVKASSESLDQCLTFIVERLKNIFLESGYKYDAVDTVLSEQGYNPTKAKKAVEQLMLWTGRDDWEEILPAYSRCVRITRSHDEKYSVNEELFKVDSERELFAELIKAETVDRESGDVDEFFEAFIPMIPAINKFFDNVLVMDEDETLQKNRLGLLQRIAVLAEGIADLSHLEGF